jgi:hypothetical protein
LGNLPSLGTEGEKKNIFGGWIGRFWKIKGLEF